MGLSCSFHCCYYRDNIWSQIKGGDWPCPTAFTCLQSFVAGKDALGPSLSLKQGFTHKGFLWKHTVLHIKYVFYLATRVSSKLAHQSPWKYLVFKEVIVSKWKNSEMFPSSQSYLPALAPDHTRPHVEMINSINPKLPVECVITLISRQQTDTSKGLCYIMRACDMFKPSTSVHIQSTLWCFVYAKEESCSSQPEPLMLILVLK